MIREKVKITKHEKLTQDIYTIWLYSPAIAKQVNPGQFIMIAVSKLVEPFLARPLSIADVRENKIRIVYRIIGKGTLALKEKRIGDSLYILGPLGNPITPVKNKNIIFCAGGVGIAPLLFLAKQLSKKNKLQLYFGAKNRHELILLDEFKLLCEKIFLATEDGSAGKKGLVTDLLCNNIKLPLSSFQYLYAAGPLPMLKQISNFQFPISNLKLYGFLEERMGCGCGICFGCGIKKKEGSYQRVCTDGPVFDLSEIEL